MRARPAPRIVCPRLEIGNSSLTPCNSARTSACAERHALRYAHAAAAFSVAYHATNFTLNVIRRSRRLAIVQRRTYSARRAPSRPRRDRATNSRCSARRRRRVTCPLGSSRTRRARRRWCLRRARRAEISGGGGVARRPPRRIVRLARMARAVAGGRRGRRRGAEPAGRGDGVPRRLPAVPRARCAARRRRLDGARRGRRWRRRRRRRQSSSPRSSRGDARSRRLQPGSAASAPAADEHDATIRVHQQRERERDHQQTRRSRFMAHRRSLGRR